MTDGDAGDHAASDERTATDAGSADAATDALAGIDLSTLGADEGSGTATDDPERTSPTDDPERTTATTAPGYPLELVGVSKTYEMGGETVVALDDVSFGVASGEFVAVIGPSGSGKSTMLNLLGLLDAPTDGSVLLRGRDVTELSDAELTDARREAIGFVFQDFYLIPTLSATENVELPTLFERGDATDRARDLLRRVGLGERLDHTPDQLSGGQKQRVAIARSLVNEPAVLLADEPTGNLDTETSRDVLSEFRRVCDEGVAVVAVTHDPLVTEYADRTVELVDGVLGEADDDAIRGLRR